MIENFETFTYESLPGRVLFGRGCVENSLASEIQSLGAQRILLITSKGRREQTDALVDSVRSKIVGVFDKVRVHVPANLVTIGCELVKDLSVDCLLSVGGGSSTGMAKAISLSTGLPIVSIPTTFSGSEMTPVWGMTDNKNKQTGWLVSVKPKVVFYDADTLTGLPAKIAGVSAINGLAHCIAGLFSVKKNPMTVLMAHEGIKSLTSGIRLLTDENFDFESKNKLQYGAYMAGSVFATVGSGLHHKLAHVLGGAYDLSHADLHAVLLPHTTRLLSLKHPEAVREISRQLGDENFVELLDNLVSKVGVPMSLIDIGMPADSLDEATRICYRSLPENSSFTQQEVYELLKSACSGRQ